MLKFFVWTIRDLTSLGILLAVLFAFASQLKFKFNKITVLSGFLTGLISSFIIAFIRYNNIIRDKKLLVFGLYLLGITFGFLLIYLIFQGLCKKSDKKSSSIIKIIAGISAGLAAAALTAYILPKYLLYPFNFLIKGQSVISTDYLFKLIGWTLGTITVFLTFLSAYKILKNIHLTWVKILTIVFALLIYLNYISSFISPMVVRRWIKIPPTASKIIDFMANHVNQLHILAVITMFLAAIILIVNSLNNREEYSNPAEHRKIRAKCRNQRRWSFAFFFFGIITIVTLAILFKYSERRVALSPAEPFQIQGDTITIPFSQVEDGLLHRFEYKDGSVGIRFIIIKKNAFAYGIGFDACEVCGATGYYMRNGQVVCKLCDVVMNINTIGFKGGCNPIPLEYEVKDGNILIKTQSLMVEKKRFK